ncbi:hypothetical protein LTR37_018413 [Vermiconidia calcicola]|uniref:Uncharacterized protein n=1 Tax=Vermiconidia calcicola TaxID=1690605 RepID=A0ACC3MH75_9PEZI|nr:hypothetical protein LTR37_018413 [Vermiconidia calcicola]
MDVDSGFDIGVQRVHIHYLMPEAAPRDRAPFVFLPACSFRYFLLSSTYININSRRYNHAVGIFWFAAKEDFSRRHRGLSTTSSPANLRSGNAGNRDSYENPETNESTDRPTSRVRRFSDSEGVRDRLLLATRGAMAAALTPGEAELAEVREQLRLEREAWELEKQALRDDLAKERAALDAEK